MRLARMGFKCDFVVDSKEIDKGIFIGLPDLAGGIEIKTLLNAKSTNAIDRNLRDAAHKDGLTCCVIDNSAGVLPDKECIEAILEKMERRHVDNVLYIDSSGNIHRYRR